MTLEDCLTLAVVVATIFAVAFRLILYPRIIKRVADRKADRLSRTCPTCMVVWPSKRSRGAHEKKHKHLRADPPIFCKECGARDPSHLPSCSKLLPIQICPAPLMEEINPEVQAALAGERPEPTKGTEA